MTERDECLNALMATDEGKDFLYAMAKNSMDIQAAVLGYGVSVMENAPAAGQAFRKLGTDINALSMKARVMFHI